MTTIINTANEKFNQLINYCKSNVKLVNFTLFTIAFGIRLVYIDLQDFENTELLNLFQANQNPFLFYTNSSGHAVFEPVYLFIIKLFYTIFGLNSYLLRLPSALFTALASVVLFNFIRTHLNYLAAVWTFLFLICNYYLNIESQLMHQSSLILLGIFLLINELYKVLIGSKERVVIIILINTFLFFIANQMAIVLIFELILFLIFDRKLLKNFFLILGGTLLTTNYFLFIYISDNKAFEKILNTSFNFDIFLLSFQKVFESEFYFNIFFLIFAIIALNIYFKRMEINLTRKQELIYSIISLLTLLVFYFIYKTSHLTNSLRHYFLFMLITVMFSILILKFFAFNLYARSINLLFLLLFSIFILPSITLGNKHENRNKAVYNLIKTKQDKELIIIQNNSNYLIYYNPFYFFNPEFRNNLYLNNIADYKFISRNKGILQNSNYTKFTIISNGAPEKDSLIIYSQNYKKEESQLGIYHVTCYTEK
ncbi:MAG: glycosyltransferase family 39 protein [Bacteroidetes bacterium]|nr:glycosyltransferase family 39 protein [Bacteroidota bacterium]MCA6442060.1 glycosyltransferase family 39 protein [Bacteroidota bacterium]